MLAVVCVSRLGVAALPLSLSRAPVRLSLRALRSSAAAMAGTASGTVETAEFEVDGEIVRAERFVEADVGMTFNKASLDEKIFSRPWPDEWPFPPQAFQRQDESDDADFYAVPRFCYHIDEGAVRALTNYYAENIAPGAAILDVCSSWVSHYPADFPDTMGRIAGTGMNVHELRCNAQLSEHSPRDLNVDPTLPYEDGSFDVATPLEVFREVRRVLKPGGKFILSQSNRCFPTKASLAIGMWLGMDDLQHCLVIGSYFHYAGGFSPARAFDCSPTGPGSNDPLFVVEATKL